MVAVCYGFAGVGKICVGDDIFGTVDCTCDARLVAKLSVPLTHLDTYVRVGFRPVAPPLAGPP